MCSSTVCRNALLICQEESETRNPNVKIQKFLLTSFPCPFPQQATSCYLPIPWSLDVPCCNNKCYSIVKEDCNGNMSFENAFGSPHNLRIPFKGPPSATYCKDWLLHFLFLFFWIWTHCWSLFIFIFL